MNKYAPNIPHILDTINATGRSITWTNRK